MADSGGWLVHPASFPASQKQHLPVIKETVPVYAGHIRITRDLTVGQNDEIRTLLSGEGELTIDGSFRYQACDDKVCYPPQTIPLTWVFGIEAHDPARAPIELQRGRKP